MTLPKLSAASSEPAQVVNKVVKVVNGMVLKRSDQERFPDGKDVNGEVAEWLKAMVC